MKIISWNVNGLRSAIKQGFFDWFGKTKADIICLQELKIDQESFKNIDVPDDYKVVCNHAEKKGYSGVAVFYRKDLKPKISSSNLGIERFDNEGRYLELDFGNFVLINIYLPHGGRQKENMGYKLSAYKKLIVKLKKFKDQKIIIVGDFNIAHTELDLARPRNNRNNIMFTEEERRQVDSIIELGYADTFRAYHADGEHYTWWPWLANCRARNLGWRIDYAFISSKLRPQLSDGFVLDKVVGSDHCPVGVELKYESRTFTPA